MTLERELISFPPNRTYAKLPSPSDDSLCEICHTLPARFLLKNSLLLCCKTYAYKCSKEPKPETLCYGCGKLATLVQACGPVCGEGTKLIKCPVLAAVNHQQQTDSYLQRLKDPVLRKQRQERFEETMLDRHGATSAMASPLISAKRELTLFEKYGVSDYSEYIKSRIAIGREKFQDSHDVSHWTQLASTQNSRKVTCLKLYGHESPMRLEKTVNKRRNNNLVKYGVKHPMKQPTLSLRVRDSWRVNQGVTFGSKEYQEKYNVWEKYLQTSMKNWGFPHPFQNPQFYRSVIIPAMYRTHPLTLPSGRVVSYQGYEHHAINFLLESFPEDDLLMNGELSFAYTDLEGDKHTYYPDLGIRSKQTAIEVKSPYTFACSITDGSLIQKLIAVQSHGWLPVVQVWDDDKLLETLLLDEILNKG